MSDAVNPYLYRLDGHLTRAELLDALAAMPEQLRKALEGASASKLLELPRSGDWSALQVLCHLRDATLAYAGRFRWIVFNDDPLMPDYDENNWVQACKDEPEDVPQLLELIAASRSDLVRLLSRMPESSWRRTGRHETSGTIVLEDYARHQVAHETMHLEQIRDALGTALAF